MDTLDSISLKKSYLKLVGLYSRKLEKQSRKIRNHSKSDNIDRQPCDSNEFFRTISKI